MAENDGRPLAENEPASESVNVNEGVQTGSPIATKHEATGLELRDSSANNSTEERPHEQAQSDIESDESSGLSDDAKESLRTAIEKGDHDEVKRMVAREDAIDIELAYDLPDAMDSKHITPLMLAVIRGQTKIVELLLKLKAEVNTSTAGWRALDFAFLNDQPAIAETLLKNGAGIGVRNTIMERTSLHWAADRGFLNCVKLLVKKGADVNVANYLHVTPLHVAISKGHIKIVEILLESGANIEAVDNDEWNCLHYACRANQTEIVKLLLEKGANKSHILNGIDNHGCTPLQIAGESDVETVELLLQQPGIEVAIRDADGDTPLSQAAWDKNHEVMLRLLTSDKYFPKDPVRSQACLSTSLETERILPVLEQIVEYSLYKTEAQFEAMIFWAVSNGHVEFVRENCLAGVEMKPLTRKVGDTTWLHIAAKYGQEEMIIYLLREGFELETVAVDGITAFHLVAESGNSNAAITLCAETLRKSCNDNILRLAQLIIQKDDQGKSPLSLCVRGHHKDTERLFSNMLRLFVSEHGSHDNRIFQTHPNEANQLLELAAELGEPGDEKFLAILFDAWFDSPKEDVKGWTVLHLAVYHRQVVPVWWLLSNGSHLGSKEMQHAKEISSSRRKSEDDNANRNNKKSEENEENKQLRLLIAEMLHNPPPIASHMDQDDEGFPNPPRISHDVLRPNALEGAIIDVHRKEGQDKLDLQFKQEDLSKIIYDSGPGEIMSTARNKNWRDLHSLKENINERLNKNTKTSGLGTHLTSDKDSQRQPSILTEDPIAGDVSVKKHPKKTTEDEKSAKHPDSLAYRWIHIPTNDVWTPFHKYTVIRHRQMLTLMPRCVW